ncbi:hypothetical protein OG241_32995 [Streptomyces sp. NBC_01390]
MLTCGSIKHLLYVTTARYGVQNPTAASGAVLSVPAPVAGTPACSWRARH